MSNELERLMERNVSEVFGERFCAPHGEASSAVPAQWKVDGAESG